MLTQGEDVEVTSLYLQRDGDKEGVERAKEAVNSQLEHARTQVKEEEKPPAAIILDEARKGYDLLALSATERRTSGGESSLFDRLTDEVIQDAPCPILVISSRSDGSESSNGHGVRSGHILVPTSGNQYDRYAAEVAFALAAQSEAEVDVVHVVSGPQHAVRIGESAAIGHAMEIGEDLVEKIAELGRSMGATVNTDVLVADQPEHAIVERSEERADLIVLASSRRPVSQRAFFGHRIDYVVGNAPCPVLVVSAR
jgi:nucleotide-binding universal stress UspA family protein